MLAAGPFGLGPLELGLLLLVLIMVFGATRLADIGGSLGKGIKEFRKNVRDEEEETETPEESGTPSASAEAPPAADAAAAASVRCSNCGTLNPVGSKHCNECGTAIAAPVS